MDKNLNDLNEDICKCTVIHNEIVDKVKKDFLNEEESIDIAEFFKVLGDNTRIKIIYALSKEEMCVCDISALLSMSQSAISHQLKALRVAKLVKFRKDGKVTYYSLSDAHVESIFNQAKSHINEK